MSTSKLLQQTDLFDPKVACKPTANSALVYGEPETLATEKQAAAGQPEANKPKFPKTRFRQLRLACPSN